MTFDVFHYAEWVWIAVGGVWLLGALRSKRAARTESPATRLLHVGTLAAVFALMFCGKLGIGPLGWRMAPQSPGVEWTGFILTVAGCAFAVWARLLLGGNWSASVTVKHDHRLIRRGPYTIVRHPIYSGFLLALLGTAIVLGELRGLLSLVLAFVGWRMKSRIEEQFMTQQFGAEYAQYAREVKALIPFVL